MIPPKPQRRLFLVTFDIPGARGGDRRYHRVDRYLESVAVVYKPAKQIRLIVTDAPPWAIDRAIRRRIGAGGGVMVLRIARYSSVDFPDPGVLRRVRSLIRGFGRK
jgi:hypothetical protein